MKNYLFNADFILARNRFAWIDYVRGICIILVSYRHCFEGLNTQQVIADSYPILKYINVFLFSFRMPLFFLVSGLFVTVSLQKKGLRKYIKDRFSIIYYPLLIWGVIQISLQLIFADYVNVDRKWIDYWYLIVQPRKIEQFWYLNALFLAGIIYATIKVKLKINNWQHLIIAICFYGIGAYLHHIRTGAYVITDVMHYYIFFALGSLLSKPLMLPDITKQLTQIKYMVPLSILFVVTHYIFFTINYSKGKDFYVEHYMPLLFLLVSLTGCAFIILVSMYLEKWKVLRFLRIVGYHSMYIYVVHLIVLGGTRILFLNILHIHNIPLLMLIAITLATIVPIILYNVLSKSGAWWLFTLKKPADELSYKKITDQH